MWWQEDRGAGTPRHNKADLKGKGIIRFIASNKSWKILIQLINPAPKSGAEKVNRGQICEAGARLKSLCNWMAKHPKNLTFDWAGMSCEFTVILTHNSVATQYQVSKQHGTVLTIA